MRYLRYVALLGILLVPAAFSHAQVSFGVGVNVGAPPVCAYGYYDYAPYDCAPYGFYGPDYFIGGRFIGAGPWFHGYRPGYAYRGGYGYRGYAPAERVIVRGGYRGEPARGFSGGGNFRGNEGGNFHGNVGGGFRGGNSGGSFHGNAGGGSRGGGGGHGGHR